jgi:hypothetical protein
MNTDLCTREFRVSALSIRPWTFCRARRSNASEAAMLASIVMSSQSHSHHPIRPELDIETQRRTIPSSDVL